MVECFSCQKKIDILDRQGDKKFIIRHGYIPNEKMTESDKLCQSCLDEIVRTQTQEKTSDTKMGKGMGIGIGVVVILVLIVGYSLYQEGAILGVVDDARFGELFTQYDDDRDRLTVVLYLTNKDGDYTKANGVLKIKVDTGNTLGYFRTFEFTKDDFSTFKTIWGEDRTGFRVSVNKYFTPGDHNVYGDVVLESGSSWVGDNNLRASFYS